MWRTIVAPGQILEAHRWSDLLVLILSPSPVQFSSVWVLFSMYDLNHFKALTVIPQEDFNLESIILWSIVSNAALGLTKPEVGPRPTPTP